VNDNKPVIIYCTTGMNSAIYTIWSIRSLKKFNYEPIEVIVSSEDEKLFIQEHLPGQKCYVSNAQLGSFRSFSFKAFTLSKYKPDHEGRDIVVCDADVLFVADPTPLFSRFAARFWFHKLYPVDLADYDLKPKDVSPSRWSFLTLLHYREMTGHDDRPPWILNSGLFMIKCEWYDDLMRQWAEGIQELGPDLMLNDQSILTMMAYKSKLEPVWEREYGYSFAVHYLSTLKDRLIVEAERNGFDHDNLREMLVASKPEVRWSGGLLSICNRALAKLRRMLTGANLKEE